MPRGAPTVCVVPSVEKARKQTRIGRRNLFCVGVRWERQPPSTRERGPILPQGEKHPLFSVQRRAVPRGGPPGHGCTAGLRPRSALLTAFLGFGAHSPRSRRHCPPDHGHSPALEVGERRGSKEREGSERWGR